jgi:hypothetical protein
MLPAVAPQGGANARQAGDGRQATGDGRQVTGDKIENENDSDYENEAAAISVHYR